MTTRIVAAAGTLLLAVLPATAADKYTAKVAETVPPDELADPVRKLFGDRCVQVTDDKGELLAEVWFRKELPAKATAAQVKNGLTYRQLPETTIVAAVRVPKQLSDYRKQKVPAGVYTMRLAFQPMDGDHMGTAAYNEFCLVAPAADDKVVGTIEPKTLHELSAKATGGHPGVFLLFPGRDAGDEPKVVGKDGGHWVLLHKLNLSVGGTKATLGIGLALVGQSPAA